MTQSNAAISRMSMELFAPNPRQWQFCSAGGGGSKAHEILLSGPNQIGGKTFSLRYIITAHSTGRYPPEWEGPRFAHAPHLAVAGETAQATRDQITDALFGMYPNYGSGWIPSDCYDPIADFFPLRGPVSNMLDYALIDHHGPDGKKNGKTILRFFGYAKGYRRVQGYELDGLFLNEMPPDDVYSELRARINATLGYIWIAACPLAKPGVDETYKMFERDKTGYMLLLNYTIDDCTHLTREAYDFNFNRWKDHPEAEARLYGRPCRGAGVIYGYPRREMMEAPFRSESALPQIIGLDLPHGTGTFAALRAVFEKERDVVHIVDEYKDKNKETPIYVDRVRRMGGDRIPIAWPHDGGRGFGATTSGGTIAEKYKSYGLWMLRDSAFMWDHNNKRVRSVMTVIEETQDRLVTGRLKIGNNCRELLDEMRSYRHDKGQVAANQDDHLIDALHKLMMMLREARIPGSRYEQTARKLDRPREDYDFYSA